MPAATMNDASSWRGKGPFQAFCSGASSTHAARNLASTGLAQSATHSAGASTVELERRTVLGYPSAAFGDAIRPIRMASERFSADHLARRFNDDVANGETLAM